MALFSLFLLQISEKVVPLHCVFHSIRFKVKRLEQGVAPFFMPIPFLLSKSLRIFVIESKIKRI